MAVPCRGAGHNQSYPNCICPHTPTTEGPGYDPYTARTRAGIYPLLAVIGLKAESAKGGGGIAIHQQGSR